MSIDAMLWAAERSGAKGTAQLVLIHLANHLNASTGKCCPSIRRLHALTGLKPHTIIAALDKLERAGLIARQTTNGRATHYELAPANQENRASPTVAEMGNGTVAEMGNAPLPKTATEPVSKQELNLTPSPTPSPRGGAGEKRNRQRPPAGDRLAPIYHRQYDPRQSTRSRSLAYDLTDTSWAT